MRRGKYIIAAAVLLLAGLGTGWWWLGQRGHHAGTFRQAPLKQGDIVAYISATGTVEPEEVVDVGTQVAGIISAFGKDVKGQSVDYGSVVDKGTVLAKIDDSLYQAAVDTAKAQVQQAQANLASAQANILQMKAKLLQAQQDWERAQRLGPSDALAQSAYDQYRASYEVAKANLAAAEAAQAQAGASVAQARASLKTAEINLSYCTIKSPVKGVVIDRRVNTGQTVVASLSAPSLFLLAKDLRRISVWVSVNEADVGSIYKGQPVSFTVDALPNRQFEGRVGKIRLNATMTQNVVTYTVEVSTNNDDGKLLPYLTANARFELGRRQDVLLAPNAALRWAPRPQDILPAARQPRHGQGKRQHPGPEAQEGQEAQPEAGQPAEGREGKRGTLWVEQDGYVRPLHVRVGLSDGSFTEVRGKGLDEDMPVVIDEESPETASAPEAASERSPLMPQPFRGRHGGPAGPGGPGQPGQEKPAGGRP